MTDYTKTVDFASKDNLPSGDTNKVIRGSEFDVEFEAIETSISSKADLNSPTLTGTPTAPTASSGVSTTQIATCAFVQQELDASSIANNSITAAMLADDAVEERHLSQEVLDLITGDTPLSVTLDENSVTATELNVDGNGTSGQILTSDGDGSFSWVDQQDVNDLAAGSTGTTSLPPIGAVVLARANNLQANDFATGYGSTVVLGSGKTLSIPYDYGSVGGEANFENAMSIAAGTWRYLGCPVTSDTPTVLMQRVS